MSEPVNPQNAPYPVDVEQGKTYHWCACGKSKNQPYCDGAHQGTDFLPTEFTAKKTETAYLCGCRKTGNAPFCDGSHNN